MYIFSFGPLYDDVLNKTETESSVVRSHPSLMNICLFQSEFKFLLFCKGLCGLLEKISK